MKDTVFLDQKAATIRSQGYVLFSNAEFAREIMAALPRPEFKNVQYIDGVGRYAVDGYIFLPRARRSIMAIVKRELKEIEEYAESYRHALSVLLKQADNNHENKT